MACYFPRAKSCVVYLVCSVYFLRLGARDVGSKTFSSIHCPLTFSCACVYILRTTGSPKSVILKKERMVGVAGKGRSPGAWMSSTHEGFRFKSDCLFSTFPSLSAGISSVQFSRLSLTAKLDTLMGGMTYQSKTKDVSLWGITINIPSYITSLTL